MTTSSRQAASCDSVPASPSWPAGSALTGAGWFALTGRITVGQFVTVIGLAQFLGEPFGVLAVVPAWIAEARASANRIGQLADAEFVLAEASAATPVAAGLTFTGVSCGPLANLDLSLRPGEFVGLVAHRPADAEELIRLLGGHVADYRGDIRVGDADFRDLAGARDVLLVEPHHNDLFTGTLRANLMAGDDAGAEAAALRAAAADEVVDAHPERARPPRRRARRHALRRPAAAAGAGPRAAGPAADAGAARPDHGGGRGHRARHRAGHPGAPARAGRGVRDPGRHQQPGAAGRRPTG